MLIRSSCLNRVRTSVTSGCCYHLSKRVFSRPSPSSISQTTQFSIFVNSSSCDFCPVQFTLIEQYSIRATSKWPPLPPKPPLPRARRPAPVSRSQDDLLARAARARPAPPWPRCRLTVSERVSVLQSRVFDASFQKSNHDPESLNSILCHLSEPT